jgi:hypothetical protein
MAFFPAQDGVAAGTDPDTDLSTALAVFGPSFDSGDIHGHA